MSVIAFIVPQTCIFVYQCFCQFHAIIKIVLTDVMIFA
jgi:uncharacterized membrane protein YqaE (UPF0057 family)